MNPQKIIMVSTTILKEVIIGVVSKDIPRGVIAAGNFARIIKPN